MDLDNNQYPDILVGAYDSNNAVYLKSAPVVHLDSEGEQEPETKQADCESPLDWDDYTNSAEFKEMLSWVSPGWGEISSVSDRSEHLREDTDDLLDKLQADEEPRSMDASERIEPAVESSAALAAHKRRRQRRQQPHQ